MWCTTRLNIQEPTLNRCWSLCAFSNIRPPPSHLFFLLKLSSVTETFNKSTGEISRLWWASGVAASRHDEMKKYRPESAESCTRSRFPKATLQNSWARLWQLRGEGGWEGGWCLHEGQPMGDAPVSYQRLAGRWSFGGLRATRHDGRGDDKSFNPLPWEVPLNFPTHAGWIPGRVRHNMLCWEYRISWTNTCVGSVWDSLCPCVLGCESLLQTWNTNASYYSTFLRPHQHKHTHTHTHTEGITNISCALGALKKSPEGEVWAQWPIYSAASPHSCLL